jgi:hypothetical protein
MFAQKIITSTFGDNFRGRTIYIYDVESGIKKAIYSTDQNHVFADHNVKLSLSNNLVAAIARSIDYVHGEIYGRDYIDHTLLLISLKGVLVRTIPNVQRYAWSPDGKKLVCILGKEIEGFGFAADSLIIVSINKWEKRIISPKVGYQDIYWAEFDSMLYATDYFNVHKINPENGSIVKVNFKGIYFSSIGEYYYQPNYEGGGFKLFESKSNLEITPPVIKKEHVNFYQWISNDEIVIGDVISEKKIIVVSTGKIMKTFTGQMIGYDPKTSEIYVHKDKKVFKALPSSKIEKIKIAD